MTDERAYSETRTHDGFYVRRYEPDEMNLVEIVVYPPQWRFKQVVSGEMLAASVIDVERMVAEHAVRDLKAYISKEVLK